MTLRNLTPTLACFLLALSSCQKELTFENADDNLNNVPPANSPSQGNQKLFRIQQGVDPDLSNDTVYLISYDASGKIKNIVDSLSQDTITATYDAAGKLIKVVGNFGDNAVYTYNGSNQLAEISYLWVGSKEKFVFTYSGGVVQKKAYYSDLGSGGALQYLGEFVYTITGGNITTMRAFTSGGVMFATVTFNYGSQPNTLKELSLFNYANRLGMDYIMDVESYFSNNLRSAVAVPAASLTLSNLYSFNGQLLTKATANNGSGLFTWQFYYE